VCSVGVGRGRKKRAQEKHPSPCRGALRLVAPRPRRPSSGPLRRLELLRSDEHNFTSGTNSFANTYIGFSAGAIANTLNVYNTNTVLSTGSLGVGYSGSGNRLVISNGGTVANNATGFIGYFSANNSVLVTGAGVHGTKHVDIGRKACQPTGNVQGSPAAHEQGDWFRPAFIELMAKCGQCRQRLLSCREAHRISRRGRNVPPSS